MKRLTFDGNFCDIAMCSETPGGSFCEDGSCSQRKVWERLKEYEDAGAVPVVRCGECLNHIHEYDVDFLCTRTGFYTRHDDFCSYGERRKTGDVREES